MGGHVYKQASFQTMKNERHVIARFMRQDCVTLGLLKKDLQGLRVHKLCLFMLQKVGVMNMILSFGELWLWNIRNADITRIK